MTFKMPKPACVHGGGVSLSYRFTADQVQAAYEQGRRDASKAVTITDDMLCRLSSRLWEEGHISDLSRETATIFGRAVLALDASGKEGT